MVAEDGSIKADLAHGDGVVKVLTAIVGVSSAQIDEAGVEARAGQKGIAGVELEYRTAGRFGGVFCVGDHGSQAVDAAIVGNGLTGVVAQVALSGNQPGFLVADVENGDFFSQRCAAERKGQCGGEGFQFDLHRIRLRKMTLDSVAAATGDEAHQTQTGEEHGVALGLRHGSHAEGGQVGRG